MFPDLVASDLTVVVAFGAAGAVLVAVTTVVVGVIIGAIGDGDAVGDVQRFVELSAASRYSLLPDGPLLSDPHGDVSEAIAELLTKKEEARRALWSSRDAAVHNSVVVAPWTCSDQAPASMRAGQRTRVGA